MASQQTENPQAENGHVDIANEIMDQLCSIRLSGGEWNILMAVLRKTWGWKKKWDWISISQFSTKCSMARNKVCLNTRSLVTKRVLLKDGNRYSFNKFYSQWGSAQTGTSAQMGSTQMGNRVVPKWAPTKDNITKDNKLNKSTKCLDDKKFWSAWDEWVAYRREVKKSLTISAVRKQIKQLAEWGVDKAVQSINNSIQNSYQGLFEPKKGGIHGGGMAENPTRVKAKPGKYANIGIKIGKSEDV